MASCDVVSTRHQSLDGGAGGKRSGGGQGCLGVGVGALGCVSWGVLGGAGDGGGGGGWGVGDTGGCGSGDGGPGGRGLHSSTCLLNLIRFCPWTLLNVQYVSLKKC